jgi:hypothetical protein
MITFHISSLHLPALITIPYFYNLQNQSFFPPVQESAPEKDKVYFFLTINILAILSLAHRQGSENL